MKTSLSHLPQGKQHELAVIKEIILSQVKAQMIILFGSYATGKWVEDSYVEDGITYEYTSDFDILVITKNRLSDMSRNWLEIDRSIARNPGLTKTVIISHGIGFVNEKIRDNYYFFVDILQEGILLYDSGKYQLATPEPLTPKKRKKKAEGYFEYWSEKGSQSYEFFEIALEKQYYNFAAFLLHQATECYYAALLLVFTDYRPKTHDIEDLGAIASKIDSKLQGVFPCAQEEEKRLFKLLKDAYVHARYDKDYVITLGELTYLGKRVQLLRELTEQLCQAEIARLTAAINS